MTDEESDRPDERDPFGRLDEAAADREGDPFESLSDLEGTEGTGSQGGPDTAPDETGTDSGEGPTTNPFGDDSTTPGPSVPDGEGPREPQSGTGTPSGSSRVETGDPEIGPGDADTDPGDPFSAPDSAFQHVDVGEIDEGDVWEAISDAKARGSVADVGERTYAEVSKHSFCEGCEHFTGPPEVACTNDGTEILEFLDMDTVRVVDCPIVAERRDLERGEGTGP